ncbi:transmembrane 4 L6 family member 5-like, partial [Clarias magur]
MCTGKCSRFVAGALYPLAVISIICNIILFFPDWTVVYAQDGHLTEEVKYMGGLVGGGLMMFLSILFAAVGVCGALYSFAVAVLGLVNGPYCKVLFIWTTPFKNQSESYLKDRSSWNLCTEPKGVVEFNVGLFSTLLVCSALQLILCASQMINGLIGCICGTCVDKG